MVRETLFGVMGVGLTASTLMTKKKDMDSSHGKMDDRTEDNGKMVSKMEEEYLYLRTVRRK